MVRKPHFIEGLGLIILSIICIGFLVGVLQARNELAKRTPPNSTAPVPLIPSWFWTAIVFVVACVSGMVIWYVYRIYRFKQEEYDAARRIQERDAEALESAAERLKDQMALPSLVNFNRILLDKYHGIATEQAESSFRSSRRAMWCGFAWLLVCFSAAVFLPAATHAQLLPGSLAVTGGALSAFLGRTYIHVYERALQQLNEYFDQPLLNNYLLSAERIIGEMDEQHRDQAYNAVIKRLLEGSSRLSIVDSQSTKTKAFSARRGRSPDGTHAAGQELSNPATDSDTVH